jgi:hypothetical protein
VERDVGPRHRAPIVLWLNAERHELAIATDAVGLLDLLAASGIAYRLRRRAWQDPALADAPLLDAVGDLAGPLEIVLNGRLATVGVARIRLAPGDEVVVGQPAHLRQRFAFFE